MVRLEKIVYEQLVNTRALKRERLLSRPSKWYSEPRTPVMRVAAVRLFGQGLTGQLFHFLEPFIARFTYQWQRDYMLQRGLAMEDLVVFQDRELRRDPLFEHIMRESFHPLTWILYNKRRARYYKVERSVRGTFVPDWLRKEAEQRTLADAVEIKDEWDSFVYKQYMSDMTPSVRPSTMPKYIFLEFLHIYGWLRPDAWDRYFYNEVFYNGSRYSDKELNDVPNPWPQFNLSTEDGRRKFEVHVNRFIGLYPGAVTKEGEKFDFEHFYALDALRNQRDLSRFSPQLIGQLRQQIEANQQHKKEKKGHHHSHHHELPGFLKTVKGTGLFTQH